MTGMRHWSTKWKRRVQDDRPDFDVRPNNYNEIIKGGLKQWALAQTEKSLQTLKKVSPYKKHCHHHLHQFSFSDLGFRKQIAGLQDGN